MTYHAAQHMTYAKAVALARRVAKRRGREVYVVRDGQDYAAAFADELDGYFGGYAVVEVVFPEGDKASDYD